MCFWCTSSCRGVDGILAGETSRKSIFRESAPSNPEKSSESACCGVKHSARGLDRTMLMIVKGLPVVSCQLSVVSCQLLVVSCQLLVDASGVADVLKLW